MKKKIIVGALTILISSFCIGNCVGAASGAVNFFLEKVSTMESGPKKELGVTLLRTYLDTENPDLSGLKRAITIATSSEEIEKLQSYGYTLDEALKTLDDLQGMSRNNIQSLIQAIEAGDQTAMMTIINNHNTYVPPNTPGGNGGGGTSINQPSIPELPTKTTVPEEGTIELEEIKTKFKDIEGHWASKEIEFLTNLGLIKGQSKDLFNPNGRITRAEFTTLIVKLLDLKLSEETTIYGFEDVQPQDWYYEIIHIARQHGIIAGVNENSFSPNQLVTREQMITIIMRGLQLRNPELLDTRETNVGGFEDKDMIAPWAVENISKAVNLGIVRGRNEKVFDPKGAATRAEAAVIIKKVFELVQQ